MMVVCCREATGPAAVGTACLRNTNVTHEWNEKIDGSLDQRLPTPCLLLLLPMTVFMVLSSWLGHCESSLGSCDECRLSTNCQPSDQANWLGLWVRLSSSTPTVAIYYYPSFYRPTEGRGLSRPDWLQTEMVYPPADSHPSKCQPGPTERNSVDQCVTTKPRHRSATPTDSCWEMLKLWRI